LFRDSGSVDILLPKPPPLPQLVIQTPAFFAACGLPAGAGICFFARRLTHAGNINTVRQVPVRPSCPSFAGRPGLHTDTDTRSISSKETAWQGGAIRRNSLRSQFAVWTSWEVSFRVFVFSLRRALAAARCVPVSRIRLPALRRRPPANHTHKMHLEAVPFPPKPFNVTCPTPTSSIVFRALRPPIIASPVDFSPSC
jgi:hypothetical protein